MTRSAASVIGRRIHVIGNTGAGKSTMAERLAQALQIPCVELDAINWQPNWVGLNDSDPDEFRARIAAATAGDAWVVAGMYFKYSRPIFWHSVQTVIWLDPPVPLLVWRVLRRSWRRWRSKELLWGTNIEHFWPHLRIWDRDSLVWWAVTQSARKRREIEQAMQDPQWAHIHFVRLSSFAEADRLVSCLQQQARPQPSV